MTCLVAPRIDVIPEPGDQTRYSVLGSFCGSVFVLYLGFQVMRQHEINLQFAHILLNRIVPAHTSVWPSYIFFAYRRDGPGDLVENAELVKDACDRGPDNQCCTSY